MKRSEEDGHCPKHSHPCLNSSLNDNDCGENNGITILLYLYN